MPLYAVGYADFFGNDLKIELVLAANEKEAIKKHTAFNPTELDQVEHIKEWLDNMPDTKEEIKQFFFNADSLVDVVLIHDGSK